MATDVITLTMGDCAENHVHNQQLGKRLPAGEGFQRSDFDEIVKKVANTEIVNLTQRDDQPDACILVIRDGVNSLLGEKGKASLLPSKTTSIFSSGTFKKLIISFLEYSDTVAI